MKPAACNRTGVIACQHLSVPWKPTFKLLPHNSILSTLNPVLNTLPCCDHSELLSNMYGWSPVLCQVPTAVLRILSHLVTNTLSITAGPRCSTWQVAPGRCGAPPGLDAPSLSRWKGSLFEPSHCCWNHLKVHMHCKPICDASAGLGSFLVHCTVLISLV